MKHFRLEPVPVETLQASVGKEVGVSPWRMVTQNMVDAFADATDDHQFIHVNPERAVRETPFGGTIAHGFLSLSLLSAMVYDTIPPLKDSSLSMNKGFDSLRFHAPIRTGARVRARFVLATINVRRSGWVEMTYDTTIEIENQKKPALTAQWLTLTKIDVEAEKA